MCAITIRRVWLGIRWKGRKGAPLGSVGRLLESPGQEGRCHQEASRKGAQGNGAPTTRIALSGKIS